MQATMEKYKDIIEAIINASVNFIVWFLTVRKTNNRNATA